MNTIQIKGWFPVFFGLKFYMNRTYETPTSWNELTIKQLYRIAIVLHSKPIVIDGTIRLVRALLGMRMTTFLHLTKHQVYDLLPITQFVLKSNGLTDNLVPRLKVGDHMCYGPNNRLSNITIEEFSFADTFYTKYKSTGDKEWLHLLCSALYRHKRLNYKPDIHSADIRQPFDKHLVFKYGDNFKALELSQSYAIALFFEGCRNEITKKFRKVFSSIKPKGRSFGWGGILVEIAGTKFGDLEQTKKANLYEVLNYLEMEGIKAVKQKASYNKLKSKYARRR